MQCASSGLNKNNSQSTLTPVNAHVVFDEREEVFIQLRNNANDEQRTVHGLQTALHTKINPPFNSACAQLFEVRQFVCPAELFKL